MREHFFGQSLAIVGEQVARAAEEMIAQHGDSALVEADKQIRTCQSEGFDYVTEAWKLIREVIRDTQQSDTMTERYEKALNKGVFLSE
ncbi:MAG: hypothetical protein ACTSYK_02545 [Alphaproteobacteria bacterium]